MKDLIRIKTLISADIEGLLNIQLKMEAYSSSVYLSMASWCNRNGYNNSANYFFKRADKVRTYQLKYFRYILDMGGNAISPDISNIKKEYNSFREVFEDALDQEINVTQSTKKIYAICMKEQDFVTMEFLNWFLKEQRDNEYYARLMLEKFEVIGEEGTGRWQIDNQAGELARSANKSLADLIIDLKEKLDQFNGSGNGDGDTGPGRK